MSNIAPPPRIIGFCIGHEGAVTALHFTEERDDVIPMPSLISGSDIGEIFIWNLETERTYHRITQHNGKMISFLSYYQSSLISQGRDGKIHISKFTNGQWTITCTLNSSSHSFCSSVLFPTESNTYLIAPIGDKSTITFYNYKTLKVLNNYVQEASNDSSASQEMCICMKVFMEKMKIVLLLGYDSGYIRWWDYELNKEISSLQCHPEIVLCLDYDPNYRNRGISGSMDNNLQVWKKTDDNHLLKVHQITITNPGVTAVKIRSDGKIVISAGQDGNIRIFSWKSLKALAVLNCHRQPISSLQCRTEPFGKNNLIFASGSKDKNVCLTAVFF